MKKYIALAIIVSLIAFIKPATAQNVTEIPPAPIAKIKFTRSANEIEIDWDEPVGGASGYEIYWSGTQEYLLPEIQRDKTNINMAETNYYKIKNLQIDTTYYVAVAPYNEEGHINAELDVYQVNTGLPRGTLFCESGTCKEKIWPDGKSVVNAYGTIYATAIKIYWEPLENAASYEINYRIFLPQQVKGPYTRKEKDVYTKIEGLESGYTVEMFIYGKDKDGKSLSSYSEEFKFTTALNPTKFNCLTSYVECQMEPATLDDLKFPDTKNHKYEKAINTLHSLGIIFGYPNGTFRPDDTIKRSELTKLSVLADSKEFNIDDTNNSRHCFPDVSDQWFVPYVCFAKSKNFIAGYSDKTFRPGNPVKQGEALKILLKGIAQENSPPFDELQAGEQWYMPYLKRAKEYGMVDDMESFIAGEDATRGWVCDVIYRYLMYMLAQQLENLS